MVKCLPFCQKIFDIGTKMSTRLPSGKRFSSIGKPIDTENKTFMLQFLEQGKDIYQVLFLNKKCKGRSEYPASSVIKWSKRGRMPNGLVFKCNLYRTAHPFNTLQIEAILFSYVLVQFSNCRSSTQHINRPFEYRTN